MTDKQREKIIENNYGLVKYCELWVPWILDDTDLSIINRMREEHNEDILKALWRAAQKQPKCKII